MPLNSQISIFTSQLKVMQLPFSPIILLFINNKITDRTMENSNQKPLMVVTTASSSKAELLINSDGVYQLSPHHETCPKSQQRTNSSKRIFDSKKKIQAGSKEQNFIVRINQESHSKDINIQGVSNLQKLFSLVGHYCYIVGLQEMATSLRKIGQGAFAQVFEVKTNYGKGFAVKSFNKKGFAEGKNKASFYNEVNILKILQSPFIIPFQYIFETDKAFYLKMQNLDLSLKQRLARKLLIHQQKQLTRQLLLALINMKKHNIIHRDLKPENIMVRVKEDGSEECVIIDFGLATKVDEKDYLFIRCGTPGFLAPEIANCATKKQKQTCAIDMFSLGCIFFKMITGHHIFGGRSSKEILANNKKGTFNRAFFSRLSQNENSLMMKMLETNPIKRITPQNALKEPYFQTDIDDNDEIAEEECTVNRNIKKISSPSVIKSMDSVNQFCSSMLSESSYTSQANRLRGNQSIRDSCITFQFGNNLVLEEESLKKSRNSRIGASSNNHSSFSRTPPKTNLRTSRFSNKYQDFTKIM